MLPLGGQLFAEEKPVSGTFVVSFAAEGDQKAWVVNALEQNIYNDLAGYARIIPFLKLRGRESECKPRNVDCLLQLYQKHKVDALMLGKVDDSEIDYEIYDIQNKFLIKTGSIDIGSGSSLLKLRMGAFSAFKPFIEKGGILDKKKFDLDKASKIATVDDLVLQNKNKKLKIQTLIVLAVIICFPYFLTFIRGSWKNPERGKIVWRRFHPFQIPALSFLYYLYYSETKGGEHVYQFVQNMLGGQQWMITGFGGVIWGLFLIINYKLVMPRLQGIERIKPNNLFPILQSCLITIVIKTLILAIPYSLLFYGVFQVGLIFSINQQVILLLLFPLSGFLAFYWAALLLDALSISIDVKLSDSTVDYNNVWHVSIKKYFIAYLKRNGVSLKKQRIDKIVFLPGKHQGVVCYGGGFSRPRISINKDLIKFVLGAIDEFNPEETGLFSRKVFQPVLRQNSIMRLYPDLSFENVNRKFLQSRYDNKRTRALDTMRTLLQSDIKPQERKYREKIENLLQGIVLPKLLGPDAFPSLMSDNLDEMQVVEELLQENSIGFDPYDEDAEIDDSSENDKDFLFGALLHKYGTLLRHEDIFSTLYLYFHREKGEKKRPYNFFYSKYFSTVADTFVVLNFGLNHLLQHLYYQSTGNASPLTTKGVTSGMLISQDEILTETKEMLEQRTVKTIQTDELERIAWLSKFCHEPIDLHKRRIAKSTLVFRWSAFLVFTYFITTILIDAYQYHPKYLEIIAKEKQEIAEAIKVEQEKERNKQ